MADEIGSVPEWRAIAGFTAYEVSNQGQVRWVGPARNGANYPHGRLCKSRLDKDGYVTVGILPDDGSRQKWLKVHRLVCAAFNGEAPLGKPIVAHWNGIRDDNRPENLRWATDKENFADRMRHGTYPIGEKAYNRTLTEELVRTIRQRAKSGQMMTQISREMGLGVSAVNHVIHRRCWKHIP
jgi:hypothetical protein